MEANATTQQLIQQKLAAFEQLEPAFVDCFRFIQDVHGQQRFPSFSVANAVRYLHSLWVCECKDRSLSIFKNIQRYEGQRCLELLLQWQEGNTADVVEFLQQKLDTLPFSDLTRQLSEAQQADGDFGLARRLRHGRLTLLNRGMNLSHLSTTTSKTTALLIAPNAAKIWKCESKVELYLTALCPFYIVKSETRK